MHESEKNFLEKIADAIPGLRGYRDKEGRRDTDKRLREFIAAEIDRHRHALDGVKRALMSGGKLDLLDDADRVGSKMQRCADTIRFASYGYAGFFDQVKIQEEELERLYGYDSSLLGDVQRLETAVSTVATADQPAQALAELEATVDTLNGQIDGRKQLFNSPA